MRELVSKEYTPILAYAAAILLAAQFVVALLVRDGAAASGVDLLFVACLALLVLRVEAPAWARLAGYGAVVLGLLADLVSLGSAAVGSGAGGGAILASLALIPTAAWVYGASLADEGAGRALGAAAAAGLAFSALLGLTRRLVLVGAWDLGSLLQELALVLAILWFAVLAKDLSAGKRHWGGPVRVLAS